MEVSEKTKLAQVMKLFMDMADNYPDLKIVAIGAVATARQVVEYEPEMKNRVAEIKVPLMSKEEITQIIDKGEVLLRISINHRIKEGIVKCSNGSAGICHQLCLNICNAMNIVETCKNHIDIHGNSALNQALERYIEEASDTLKSSFDKAFKEGRKGKFQNGKLILQALIQHSEEGVTTAELLKTIKKKTPKYPSSNLPIYLKQLTSSHRGNLLQYEEASGKYSFADPIYRCFAMSVFANDRDSETKFDDFEQLREILLKMMEISTRAK